MKQKNPVILSSAQRVSKDAQSLRVRASLHRASFDTLASQATQDDMFLSFNMFLSFKGYAPCS